MQNITLIEKPICEGSMCCLYTCDTIETASLAELGQAIKEFQYKLNPYKTRRPRTGWANLLLDGHHIRLDVREAQRGYGIHARATFLLDGRRATWASICKALG
jgi:hypothetical protein